MIVILVLFCEIVIGALLNYLFGFNYFFSYGCVFLSSVMMCMFIIRRFKGFQLMVLGGFFLRLVLLLADYYKLFPIPNSGGDSEAFYGVSVDNLFRDYNVYITNYTVYLTALFSWIGPQRLFAQFLNVVYGIGTIYYVYRSLNLLKLDSNLKQTLMGIVCFMPNLIIFSGLLLRESIIILGTTASVYYFLLWIKQGKILNYVRCLCCVLLGAYMHSGILGVLMGYLLAIIFYNRGKEKIQIRFASVFYLLFAFTLLLFIVIQSGLFTSYLGAVLGDNAEAGFLMKANYKEEAGSAYLTWMHISSWQEGLLYLPVKVFYFLFSPFPWEGRNIGDIVAFILDSCIYLWLLWRIYFTESRVSQFCKNALIFLMLGFWMAVSMYAYGTITAGAAMRHRAKFCTLLIIAVGIRSVVRQNETWGSGKNSESSIL